MRLRCRMPRTTLADSRAPRQFFSTSSGASVPRLRCCICSGSSWHRCHCHSGNGLLVCSQLDDGTFANSGGRGWILGDHGSAARLGRAALEWFCDDPAAVGKDFTDAVIDLFGSSDWRHIQRALGSAPSRSAYLARAAPLLTSAADYGADWAITRLRDEMSGLATTTCHHIERYLRREDVIKVALAGGVWASQQASSCYGAALASACPAISITRSSLSSLDGAVRLATRMAS